MKIRFWLIPTIIALFFITVQARAVTGDLVFWIYNSAANTLRVSSSLTSSTVKIGSLQMQTSSYVNFGAVTGTNGYGFRDNGGTVQWQNLGGAWANIGSGGGTFTTTSINSVISTNFTFATTTDTNLSIQISTSSNTITFNPNWLGTLADNRISSASYWNSIQGIASSSYLLLSNTTSLPNLTQVGTLANLVWTNATGTNLNITGLTNLSNTTITSVSTTNLGLPSLATSTFGECLQTNASGTVLNALCPTAGNLSQYFQDTSSSITQYKTMVALTQTGAESYVTTTGLVNNQILMGWITATNSPNIAGTIAGIYFVHIHALQTAGTQNGFIYAQIFTRTSGGTETLLGTTPNSTILSGTENSFDLSVFIPATTTPLTNRFLVKVFATVTGGGTAPTITIGYSDFTGAGLNFPSNQADISLLVPYTGALSGLDMGAFGIVSASISSTQALFLNTTSTNLYASGVINFANALGISSGGTNSSSIAGNGSIIYSDGSKYNASAVGVSGQLLQSVGAGTPVWISTTSLGLTVNNPGTAGQGSYYATGGTTLSGTNTLFFTPGRLIGIGTTTPLANLTIQGFNVNPFSILTSTAAASSMFVVLTSGNVGVNSSSPIDTLGVQGGLQVVGGVTSTNSYVSGQFNATLPHILVLSSSSINATLSAGSTTRPLGSSLIKARTFVSLACFTTSTAGSMATATVRIGNGAVWSNALQATSSQSGTTPTPVTTLTSNNTFALGLPAFMQIGNIVGTYDYLSCTYSDN